MVDSLVMHQRELLRDLVQLSARRTEEESAVTSEYASRKQTAGEEFTRAQDLITAQYETTREATELEYCQARERVLARYESESRAAKREEVDARDRAVAIFMSDKDKALKALQEAKWESLAIMDAAKAQVEALYHELVARIERAVGRIHSLEKEASSLVADMRQTVEFVATPPSEVTNDNVEVLENRLDAMLAQIEGQLQRLRELIVPQAFKGNRLRVALVVFWGMALVSLVWITEKPFTFTLYNMGVVGLCALAPPLLGLAIQWALSLVANRQVSAVCQPMAQALAEAEAIGKKALERASADHKLKLAELKSRHERDMQAAQTACAEKHAGAKRSREANLQSVQEKYPPMLREMAGRRDRDLREIESKYPRLLTELRDQFQSDLTSATTTHERVLRESQFQYETAWSELARMWWQGIARLKAAVRDMHQFCGRLFLDWSSTSMCDWMPAKFVPPAIRFGEYTVRMDQIPHGVPQESRLRAGVPEEFTLPALLPFPEGCSTLFKAADQGRAEAAAALQVLMLRLLTSIPPGKVRFTIIDPVGLGENFAAFMHLADFDEALVTNRIWTEPQHIDQRLADLTEHMENVIQKYLRNEFETIEQYNSQAGEVAEPFRIVVVANFPANFTDATARRLVSIASSGARCGVFTLVSVDTRLPMPHGFNLSDLEQHAVVFNWRDGRFQWADQDFGQFQLQLDTLPSASTFTDLLQVVGARAREANRVEVPFEFIAPRPDQYWSSDSRLGINVPLGRAGATKTQNLRLGQGTAQHVLIAGKTGSGKSTLLHVLITNISLLYSPDEVQLYLVDFKKGVEFKTYATYELPHARVVAIESEREFGLSVLQKLDSELKRRGDLFRQMGVQDIAAYRQSNGSTPLPRILLVVDEFQEFFVEDDKIAQESSLLLDRLVRQGRAFGMHVQLGSQTLGGAYSLARSTLGQMAVRIALQCSETDAHLILSDDNTAARLLSRPGEAIYNDANGLIEGNNFFQIVWLPDDRREQYMQRIQEMAQRCNFTPAQPQIVFEGNVPSDIRKNRVLEQLLSAPDWPQSRTPTAWLGEAVAIKDPTSAMMRPQVGNNLLMVGHQDESALSIVLSAMISLGAFHESSSDSSSGARFYVLDGSPVDELHSGTFDKLCNVLPHFIQIVGPRDIVPVIQSISEELDRRQKSPVVDGPSIYLFVYDLQRFRELRRQEEEFSFSRRGEEKPPSPSKQFATILREGPPHRIHAIVWCDSLNNLNRTFERQMIREFDLRVLFQMSGGDSSTLIDSPIASRLGMHRAIFYSEEESQVEKFRPYGVPTDDWLDWVRDRLAIRRMKDEG